MIAQTEIRRSDGSDYLEQEPVIVGTPFWSKSTACAGTSYNSLSLSLSPALRDVNDFGELYAAHLTLAPIGNKFSTPNSYKWTLAERHSAWFWSSNFTRTHTMQCQRSLHLNFKKWQPLQEHLKQFYSNKFEIKLNFPQLSELMISFFSLRLLAFRLEHFVCSIWRTFRRSHSPRWERQEVLEAAVLVRLRSRL